MGPWQVISVGGRLIRRCVIFLMGLAAMVQLGPTVVMTGSMAISLVIYAAAFGVKYAAGFILLLFFHELGHLVASRVVGIPTGVPIFLPFIGAVISLKRAPRNAKMAANVAIGGPALGTLTALICLAIYFWNDSILMLVLAYTACLLNLFNLIPCDPLDGGRIASAISPHMWWVGSLVIGGLFFYTYNFIMLLIFFISLLRLWRSDNMNDAEDYYRLSVRQRLTVLWWYLGLLAVLGLTTLYTANLLR
ncbi:site-2 protease family protein [Dendrosporobacter sp. 1207_IL3150]|uniref:site-2 protease family protein n=1 Tax=Dendrosporobacter sp. 1207_IL3150 TaxID=3084054 RepID=UPI002FDAF990